MLLHPTIDTLRTLRLSGMAQALEEQLQMPEIESLRFEERLGLLLDREQTLRDSRRFTHRLRQAKLPLSASLEDIDYQAPRGLDKSLISRLSSGQWLDKHLNVLITGPTGVGKTWLACALAHHACRQGRSVRYIRLPRLLQQLQVAKGDGSYIKCLTDWAKVQLLMLDDWGLNVLTPEQCRDLLEVLEDRYQKCSTLVTSQLPVSQWHQTLSEATLADACLDRLVHQGYRLELQGQSMRQRQRQALDSEGEVND